MQKVFYKIGIVIALFSFLTIQAYAATLNFSAGQSYDVGQIFSVNVLVSTAGSESANAVSAQAAFPTDKLQLISLSKAGSIMSLWTQEPSFSNAAGTANFEGVILNPGFTGQGGRVITLNFKVIGTGLATLSFQNASVLANDGQGSNILTGSPSISLQLNQGQPQPTPPAPTPSTTKTPTPSSHSSSPQSTTTSQNVTPVSEPASNQTLTVIDTSSSQGYLLLAVILFVLLFIFFCLGLYLYHIIREIRRRIYISVEKTQANTMKAFKNLHQDIDRHLKLLRQAQSKRALTDEEESFIATFEKRLEEAESTIVKDIGNLKKKR